MTRVSVEVLPGRRRLVVELEEPTVAELLRRLGLGRESAVVVRDGRPLLEDEELRDGDHVVVFIAASGG